MLFKSFRRAGLTLAVAVALLLPTTIFGQATISTTTLAAAVTSINQPWVQLASTTGIVAGYSIYVDRELMAVTSVARTPIVDVRRAVAGTAGAHANASLVFSGPSNYFGAGQPLSGPCTSTQEIALPRIVVANGDIYDCKGATATTQVWVPYARGGFNAPPVGWLGGPAGVPPTYTSAGAITVMPGVQFIGSGGALAMTLANPTTAQNGMVMIILAGTAQAHTVTYTAGFGGGTTSRDVATFAGAINDGMTIVANNGIWWVINTRNVTLG